MLSLTRFRLTFRVMNAYRDVTTVVTSSMGVLGRDNSERTVIFSKACSGLGKSLPEVSDVVATEERLLQRWPLLEGKGNIFAGALFWRGGASRNLTAARMVLRCPYDNMSSNGKKGKGSLSVKEGSMDSTPRSHYVLEGVKKFLEEWYKEKTKEAIAKVDIRPRKVSAIRDFPPGCGRGVAPVSREECERQQQAWLNRVQEDEKDPEKHEEDD
ncbi:Uncharacterized protein TCM_009171 [Theobroma cacao]|uniref:Uncharacterized protein n=1 Tax=Theobroma cacao TaxID=3641 RepID=A0A061E4N4_THECC|nr:Uncharacterized protein TCM_009171 [Theobroma cacao]